MSMTLEVGADELFGWWHSTFGYLSTLFAKSEDEANNEEAEKDEQSKTSSDAQPTNDRPPDLGINVADDFISGDVFGG